jgi:hypothetical protein
MWLFDDILKKPVNHTAWSDPLSGISDGQWASGQGSGQSQQRGGQWDDSTAPIFIQKSSPETVFGAETEARSAAIANAPSIEPTVHAEADTSSILVSAPVTTPIQTISESSFDSITIETPMIHSAEVIHTVEPVSMMPTPPPTTSTPQVIVEAAPVINTSLATEVPQAVEVAPVNPINNSIFDSIMGWSETKVQEAKTLDSIVSVPDTVIASPVVEALAPTPVIEATDTPIAPVPQVVSLSMSPSPVTPTPTSMASSHDFSTPRDFIEQSITNIDVMLGNIDKRHTAKEVEEESYRIEKLRFTDLEKNAHTEKIIMDKEKDHVLHMRKILETELERDTANKNPEPTHVESTLKEIGSEHPIHKHTHRKAEHVASEARAV